MKQVLVLESNKELSLLSLHLSKNTLLNVVSKKDIESLVSLLDILGHVDLVICTGDNLNSLQSKYPSLTFFTYNQADGTENNLNKIFKDLGCELSASPKITTEQEQFRPISIEYFSGAANLSINSDLFIKIKKGSSVQFIKRLNANELFSTTEIEKYINLGLSEFYVPIDKYDMAVNSIINLLTSELTNDKNSFNTQKNIEHSTYNISMERLRTVGLDAFTVQLVDETVNSIKKGIAEKAALGKFLKYMMENKASYAYANSYLTCLTMTSLLKTFEWESEAIKEQITFACFFHNISLEDEAALKIFSNDELEASSFSKEKKDEIKMHALTASGIVAHHPKISPIILTIVKEHHGSPTGVDFPDIPSAKLHPMSKCFMVCEYFADQVLKKGPAVKKADVLEIVTNLKKKFSTGSYAPFVNAIEKMTSD